MASFLTAALLLCGCGARPAVTPHRIVSDNPCVDSILADVADPRQIGAISHYSHDARSASAPLAWARQFPAIGGNAEEIIAARPSLYITSAPMNPATRIAVARAGITVLAISVPNSISESEAQIRTVATAIGRASAGEHLIDEIETASHAAAPTGRAALIYQGGGLILGANTLADDELTHAGFTNAARRYGSKAWDVQPIETVIMTPPDLILAPQTAAGGEARGLSQLHHALKHHVQITDFQQKLLFCGGRSIINARQRLNAVRHS